MDGKWIINRKEAVVDYPVSPRETEDNHEYPVNISTIPAEMRTQVLECYRKLQSAKDAGMNNMFTLIDPIPTRALQTILHFYRNK
jgi:hypothetical protein